MIVKSRSLVVVVLLINSLEYTNKVRRLDDEALAAVV